MSLHTATSVLLAMVAVVPGAGAAERNLDDLHTTPLSIGKGVQLTCAAGRDTVSAVLTARGRGAAKLIEMGHRVRIGPYRMVLRRSYPDLVTGHIDAPLGIVRCAIHRTGNTIRLSVGRVESKDRIAPVRKHVLVDLDVPPNQESGDSLTKVDAAIGARKYAKALEMLKRLERVRGLRDLVSLRRADVHLAAGRIPTAFAHYQNIASIEKAMGVGLIAGVRIAQLSFYVDGKLPSEALVDIVAQMKDRTGIQARRLLAPLMLECGRPGEALRVANGTEDAALKEIAQTMFWTVLRRAFFDNNPYKVALTTARYPTLVENHPQRVRILRWAASAYIDLGLPKDATRLLQTALPAATAVADREAILAGLVDAYLEADDLYRSEETSNFYLARFSNSHRAPFVRKHRAWLRLVTGDIKGAQADIALLPEPLQKVLNRLVNANQQMGQQLSLALSRLPRKQGTPAKGQSSERTP